jgi:outer membrane protein
LKAARAAYLNFVGHEPSGLQFPSVPSGLPKSIAEALAIADQENPLVVSSLYNEQAAGHTVDQFRGRLLPQISVEATWEDDYNTQGVTFQRNTEIKGRVDVPIYDGGLTHATIRQAKQIHLGRIQTIGATRAFVQRAVSAGWSQLEAARARVELGNARIKSSQVALKGVRGEEAIGQRTLLDVLNAEQDILDSQVAQINARRDVLISSYQVLSDVGRLSAEQLGLQTVVYDPNVHYEEVRSKWFGLDITDADGGSEHIVVQDNTQQRAPTK